MIKIRYQSAYLKAFRFRPLITNVHAYAKCAFTPSRLRFIIRGALVLRHFYLGKGSIRYDFIGYY